MATDAKTTDKSKLLVSDNWGMTSVLTNCQEPGKIAEPFDLQVVWLSVDSTIWVSVET